MKPTRFLSLAFLILIFAFSGLSYGAVPQMINYQGKITTPTGALIDSSLTMVFSIYDNQLDVSPAWAETLTVQVEKGIFSVVLGEVHAIPYNLFDGTVNYLGVKAGTDPEMTPRKSIVSVAYAYRSGADGDWTIDGDDIYRLDGNVGIGTDDPDLKLDVVGGLWVHTHPTGGLGCQINGSTIISTGTMSPGYNHLHIKTGDNSSDILLAEDGGKVGIGVTAADEELHVVGNIKMVDGNQAAGKVLTSDGSGVGTWQAAAGGIAGSGTANYIPKFTASTTLGNSAIYETGSRIGIGTTTPNASSKLHVEHNNYYAGYFKSNRLSGSTHVIHAEFTGSGTYDARAVYGKSTPADYYGYGGYFEGGYTGVEGRVLPNPSGSSSYYGVRGYVSGGSGTNYAVHGYAGFGATNYAGYFAGNARVTGTLTKGGGAFQIDHPLDPENKYLFHSFVESPDMMNVYNGNVILDANGGAVVQLPDYFEALNRDFRYQLTAIGAPGPNLYISQEIFGNNFKIAGGVPGMKVSWQVTGVRHDKFAEANRIQVEVDKPEDERGKYLHPEAYKLGEEYDIHYEQNKRMKEKEDQRKLD